MPFFSDDLDGVDQSEMLLNGYGTKRSDMIYNIDLLEPAYFGHSAYRYDVQTGCHGNALWEKKYLLNKCVLCSHPPCSPT